MYALGAVTYEMLTGEPPFTGTTVQAIVAKLMTDPARPLTQLRKSVPVHVEAAVLAALEKVPADRIPSATEFGRALGDASTVVGRTGGREDGRYDVAPDGRFVMIREAAEAVGAVYGENWFAELLSKVKRGATRLG